MNKFYTALESLARIEHHNQESFAKLMIDTIETAYNEGRIDLIEKSQLLDILN